MAEDHKHKHDGNLQDQFLNKLKQSQKPVTVFLLNGIKLQGLLAGFDNFSLMLKRDAHMQLVYKHAVSTIMPSGAMAMDSAENPPA